MQDVWRFSVEKNMKRKCLENYTYRDIDEMSRFLGSWLFDNGFKVLYIHSINRWEWTLTDISCFKYGVVSVPLYDTLGLEALQHTLNLTEGKVMASSKVAAASLLKANPPSLKNITHIIQFDEFDAELTKEYTQRGIKLFPLKSILLRKMTKPYPFILPEDHLSYIFTSGTTGMPKGSIATHGNVVAELFNIA